MSAEEKVLIALRLPSTLSAYSGGKSQIMLEAETVEEVLALLEQQHPRVWERLCTEDGQLRPHVRIFVNNELVSSASDLQIKLKAGQEVIVLPSTFKP